MIRLGAPLDTVAISSPCRSSNTCLPQLSCPAALGQKPPARERRTEAANFYQLPTTTNSCDSKTVRFKKKTNAEPYRRYRRGGGQRVYSRSRRSGPGRGHPAGDASAGSLLQGVLLRTRGPPRRSGPSPAGKAQPPADRGPSPASCRTERARRGRAPTQRWNVPVPPGTAGP